MCRSCSPVTIAADASGEGGIGYSIGVITSMLVASRMPRRTA